MAARKPQTASQRRIEKIALELLQVGAVDDSCVLQNLGLSELTDDALCGLGAFRVWLFGGSFRARGSAVDGGPLRRRGLV